MTVTRRSTRPSPRPQPRDVDPEFTRLVEDWLSDTPEPVEEVHDEPEVAPTPEPDPPSRLSIGLVGMLAFIFVFGALFGLAAFHSVLVQNQLRIDRLSREVQREQARHHELRIEAGHASSPFRVIAQATARGMLPARSKEKLQAVLPEQGKLTAPNSRPFGNVSNYVPPVVSAPPPQTTAPPPQTTAPPPQTTAASTGPASTGSASTVPASTVPASTAPTKKAGT